MIAFSGDGRHILTGTFGARLWDVASGRLLRTFGPSAVGTRAVGFSPEGDVLAAGEDGVVRRWRGALLLLYPRPARLSVTQRLALRLTFAEELLGSDRTADLLEAASYYEHQLGQTADQTERADLTEVLTGLDRRLYELATAAGDDRARSALNARITGRMIHRIASQRLDEAAATGRMVLEHDPRAEWTRSLLAMVYLADYRIEELEELLDALRGRHLEHNRRLLAMLADLLDRPVVPPGEESEWLQTRLGGEVGSRAAAVIKERAIREHLEGLEEQLGTPGVENRREPSS